MKKRILAILLAGLLTASLASCSSRKGREDQTTNGGGTEPQQTKVTTAATTVAPPPVQDFEDVDDHVFITLESVKLRVSTDTVAGAVEVKGATKLHRIKTSKDWSVVEYDGKEYYVSNQSITTDDLIGESFTTCEPTVMYLNSNANLRKYASSTAPVSVSVKQLTANTEVTVVAKGKEWYKVKYTESDSTTSYYFVFASLVSEEKAKDYSEYFTACAETTMYVNVDSCYLRSIPVINDTTIVGYRVKTDALIVVGTGTGDYKSWSRVKVADEVKEGDPQTYSYLYVSNSCLSATNPGGPAGTITIDQFLLSYTGFTKCDPKTMYVLAESNVWVRSAPVFEGEESKKVLLTSTKNEITSVKVVATGSADGVVCYVLELKEGDFGFVTSKYITPNESGAPAAPTLDEILAQYKNFALCTVTDAWATGKVNCYSTPASSSTVPHTLELGNKVEIVAEGKTGTADEIWCIIRLENGTLYFASASHFTKTQPAG